MFLIPEQQQEAFGCLQKIKLQSKNIKNSVKKLFLKLQKMDELLSMHKVVRDYCYAMESYLLNPDQCDMRYKNLIDDWLRSIHDFENIIVNNISNKVTVIDCKELMASMKTLRLLYNAYVGSFSGFDVTVSQDYATSDCGKKHSFKQKIYSIFSTVVAFCTAICQTIFEGIKSFFNKCKLGGRGAGIADEGQYKKSESLSSDCVNVATVLVAPKQPVGNIGPSASPFPG